MTVKGNQPTLLESVFRTCLPLLRNDPDHGVEERGHGRINRWSTWITDARGIDFPHVRQVGCIRREVFDLTEVRISKEYAWIVISSAADETTAGDLHEYIRHHWGIENKSHYVRDTTTDSQRHVRY